MPSFGKKSESNLATCNQDLQILFNTVIKHFDCSVLCGHRGKEDQEEAFKRGKSKARWGQSLHNTNPSDAVDVMPFPIDWQDMVRLYEFAGFVKATAIQLHEQGIMKHKVRWGGNFRSFFDGPHWETIK